MLLPALGNLGFENSAFADFDFAVWGIIIGNAFAWFWPDYYLFDLSGADRRCWCHSFRSVRVVGDTLSYEELTADKKNE